MIHLKTISRTQEAAKARAGIKEMIRRNWDLEASKFDHGESRVSRTPEVFEAWKWVFRAVLGERPLRILDVGSGTGEVCLLFAGLGHRASGIDISPEMVALSRRKAHERGAPCRFQEGDGERLPFPEETFDVVHARHLLWTLTDPQEALADWMRVLCPGGRILVTESFWDGAPPSLVIRARMRFCKIFTAAVSKFTGIVPPAPGRCPGYPGRADLPFYGGLGLEGLVRFLDNSGLDHVGARDLLWLRKLGKRSVPWYHRWMYRGTRTYHLAWGIKP